jgi:hypothetical protein
MLLGIFAVVDDDSASEAEVIALFVTQFEGDAIIF